ncbi:hypothetical protein EDD21DRAFT_75566 [Dissophora ornata]|nr:hypothetical protein EDD21DRAFT_75566 [Dissophora ornata]
MTFRKSVLDEEFDEFGKFGRKVDLTFYSGEYELANCEFKLPGASDLDVKIQNRKNIRLNRAIMESHLEASGLKLNILYFDYQGWNGSMFALFPYGDIYVSKYIESVELPRTKAGLRRFLRGETLELLFKFVYHLRQMAERLREEAEEKIELNARRKHQHLFDNSNSPLQEERRISNNVFLSPTSPSKKSRKK